MRVAALLKLSDAVFHEKKLDRPVRAASRWDCTTVIEEMMIEASGKMTMVSCCHPAALAMCVCVQLIVSTGKEQ